MSTPKLKPVSRVTLGEQVAAQLAEQISEGHWLPGDKLPSETELCATLRIGRSTLREALKSLAYVGLVQMRPGEGTYVLEGTQLLVDRIRSGGMLRTEKELEDVSEARLILETELAALAAERLEPADLERLEEILKDMKLCLDGDGRKYSALDVDFHLAIAQCSKNQLLHELLVRIRGVLQEFRSGYEALSGRRRTQVFRIGRRFPSGHRPVFQEPVAPRIAGAHSRRIAGVHRQISRVARHQAERACDRATSSPEKT